MLALFLLAGCDAGPCGAPQPLLWDPPPVVTGSSTLGTSADGSEVCAANTYDGTVGCLDRESGTLHELAVGTEPSRITWVGERLLVTVRGEGALVEFEAGKVTRRVAVGAEPVGVVAEADGQRVYVALSAEESVVELDGATLAECRRWPVEGQPTWLALHPSGETLYVASAMGGVLS